MAKLDEQNNIKRTVKSTTNTHAKLHDDEPKSDLRGRDVIYVDTDDDVTSIVERIKKSEQAVVALVPPKRVGALQSVVNLKLIQRAAHLHKKRLAIITTDQAMINLAAGLAIPVAKNINAQAVVIEMDDDNGYDSDSLDIIDGNDVSAGRGSRSNRVSNRAEDRKISAAVTAIETDDRIRNDLNADGIPDDEQVQNNKRSKAKIKVPNVNSLRKKIILIGGVVVVLIGFLIWAVVFAPSAVITIQAKTSQVEITKKLSLIPSTDRDVDNGVLSPVIKQKKVNETVKFDATGSKEVGDNAIGTVAFCYDVTKYNGDDGLPNPSILLEAGTRLYASGMQFSIDSNLEVEPGRKNDECTTYYSVKATAVNFGEEGNIKGDTQMTVSGYSDLIAIAKGNFTGGSKRTAKVIQQSDIESAVKKLSESGDSNAVKDELTSQMSGNTVVLKDSFSATQGDAKISPAIGEPVEDQATASMEITYTLVGIDKSDLNSVLDAQLKAETDSDKQKIYSNGIDDIKFSGFATTDSGYTVTISTNAHVGPIINEDNIRNEAVGKKSEEIKALINQTNGVSDVDVIMSPFWVSSAPAKDKITIKFTVDE